MTKPMSKRGPKKKTIQERINKHIIEENGHILWTGYCRKTKGDMLIPCICNKATNSHIEVRRFLYERRYKLRIPPKHKVKPKCGAKTCVKPEHMQTYFPLEGRKLSPKQVDEIRELWALHLKHKTTLQELGDRFGVSKQQVDYIVRGESWR